MKTTHTSRKDLWLNADQLLSKYQVRDQAAFQTYLIEIWNEFYTFSDDTIKGINFISFSKYFKVPGLIGKRWFEVFDKRLTNYLNKQEFIDGMFLWFTSRYKGLVKFIFNLYDSDKDGFICFEDVKQVISYIPLVPSPYNIGHKFTFEEITYTDQLEAQDEINCLLKEIFKKGAIEFDAFYRYVTNTNSNPFLFLIMTIYHFRPFNDDIIEYYASWTSGAHLSKSVNNSDITSNIPDMKEMFLIKDSKDNLIIPPNWKSKWKPYEWLYKLDYMKKFIKKDVVAYIEGWHNCKKGEIKPLEFNLQLIEKAEKNGLDDDKDIINNDTSTKSKNNNVDDDDDNESWSIQFEGIVYKITKTQEIKEVFIKFINKDLFYFKTPTDIKHYKKSNLSQIYFQEKGLIEVFGTNYYNIKLIYPKKHLNFYIKSEKHYWQIHNIFKQITQYKDIQDFDIKEKIGVTKNGMIRRGIHKETKKNVAIKWVNKHNMTFQELALLHTQWEIFSIIKHPNVLNVFEIIDYHDTCYIISELIMGGDLHSYLEKKDFKIGEPHAVSIIHQIAIALYYLEYFGIINRDIKPEHLLVEDSNKFELNIKVSNFHLSCFTNLNEKHREWYGTMCYIAPEVLKGVEYNNSCDIWSLGVISYLLLIGCLPYDDEHSEEEVKRMILNDDVPYPPTLWKKKSRDAFWFVESILRKEPKARLSIKEILESNWLYKYTKSKFVAKRIKFNGINPWWNYGFTSKDQCDSFRKLLKNRQFNW